MAQGILPFKYETEKKTTGMTALAGLPVYLDLARVMRFQFHSGLIKSHILDRKLVPTLVFQFHFGLIKRCSGEIEWLFLQMFQFHFGLIKRGKRKDAWCVTLPSFNSILV